jgi:hypothetical protein
MIWHTPNTRNMICYSIAHFNVCVHSCTLHTHTYTHTHTHIHTHAHTHTHTYTHIHTHTHTYTHAHTHNPGTLTSTCARTCAHTHTRMHMRVHTQVERNLVDAMGVARNICIDPRLVPGGGVCEMAVSRGLADCAASLQGVESWPYKAVRLCVWFA